MDINKLCTRCGECCEAIACGIGNAVFNVEHGCPALEKDGKIFSCGLVANPEKYMDLGKFAKWKSEWMSNLIAGMLGIGFGCCSCQDGRRINHSIRKGLLKIQES